MWTKVFAFVLVTSLAIVSGQGNLVAKKPDFQVSARCLGCICEAATGCDLKVGCSVPYPGAFFCGPFAISKLYWIDAGKPKLRHPDPNEDKAFADCVTDKICGAETVRLYMKKFKMDCPENALNPTCTDIMRTHKLGGYGCKGHINDAKYLERFRACANALNLN